MKPTQLLNKFRLSVDRLNSREQKLLAWGGIFAALLIGWFVLIEPALMTMQQAPTTQAALVSKAGQVMRAAQELEVLRATRSRVVVPASDLQERLQQLLIELGINEQGTLVRTEEGSIRIDFNHVSASGLLAWLAQAETISSVKLIQVEFEKVDAGILKGYVTLLSSTQGEVGNVR